MRETSRNCFRYFTGVHKQEKEGKKWGWLKTEKEKEGTGEANGGWELLIGF